MVIYNQTIYGTISNAGELYSGDIMVLVWSYDFSISKTKTYTITNGEYQINLGDSDLFGPNHDYNGAETVIIQTVPLTYSGKVDLVKNSCILHDIQIETYNQVQAEANVTTERKVITANALLLTELEVAMYSYFMIEFDGNKIHEANGQFTRFYPEFDGEYTITQKGVNITTGIYSEKVSTITLFDGLVNLDTLDYIFYTKRNIVIKLELPEFVVNTLLLAPNWYVENGFVFGKKNKLNDIIMPYAKGSVIIKTQVGDLLDY